MDFIMSEDNRTASVDDIDVGTLLLGAGFAMASLILVPVLAQRLGLGSSLTSALRVALMRASARI
jgi:hypothetical protein